MHIFGDMDSFVNLIWRHFRVLQPYWEPSRAQRSTECAAHAVEGDRQTFCEPAVPPRHARRSAERPAVPDDRMQVTSPSRDTGRGRCRPYGETEELEIGGAGVVSRARRAATRRYPATGLSLRIMCAAPAMIPPLLSAIPPEVNRAEPSVNSTGPAAAATSLRFDPSSQATSAAREPMIIFGMYLA